MLAVTREHEEFLRLLNDLRWNEGVQPVRLSQILMDAALYKAEVMATEDHYSHYEPSGRGHHDLMVAFGYPRNVHSGECILYGYNGVQGAFTAWRESPPHRAIMVDEDFTETGVALGVEPQRDYSGDVFLAGVLLFGSGNTEEAKFTDGVGLPAPETPIRTPTPTQPKVPRFGPVRKKPRRSRSERIKQRLRDLLRRRS